MSRADDEPRAFIDSIPSLAWCASPDGSAQSFNRRWLDYTGLTAEVAVGWGWKVAVHPDDLPKMLEVFRNALDTGRQCGRSVRRRGPARHPPIGGVGRRERILRQGMKDIGEKEFLARTSFSSVSERTMPGRLAPSLSVTRVPAWSGLMVADG